MSQVIRYIYTGKLACTSLTEWLALISAADHLDVGTCIAHCFREIENFPMTLSKAVSCMELRQSSHEPFRSMKRESVLYLEERFKHASQRDEELLNLPFASFKVVVSNDSICVASEDALLALVLEWLGRQEIASVEERQEIASQLLKFIRIQFLSHTKLEKLFSLSEFCIGTNVVEALLEKSIPDGLAHSTCKKRKYILQPLRSIYFEVPHPQAILYMELNREDLMKLHPSGMIKTQPFYVGGQEGRLSARCFMKNTPAY